MRTGEQAFDEIEHGNPLSQTPAVAESGIGRNVAIIDRRFPFSIRRIELTAKGLMHRSPVDESLTRIELAHKRAQLRIGADDAGCRLACRLGRT
jgi:hypothetical protein